MPISFIWTLYRPMLEQILVGMLMALGLVAAAVASYKVYCMKAYDMTGDFLYSVVEMCLISRVEELILITAACAPFLKPPIEKILCSFGVVTFTSSPWFL